MTKRPPTERVNARSVAVGISKTDVPTPSPPTQQDAHAKSAGKILLARMVKTSLGWAALDTVSMKRKRSRLPLPIHAANKCPLAKAITMKTIVRQKVDNAIASTRGRTRFENGSHPSA